LPGSFKGTIGSQGIVEKLVGKSLYVRKNEQSVNILVVIPALAALVAIPYFYVKAISWAAGSAQRRADAGKIVMFDVTPTMNISYGGPVITFVPTYGPTGSPTTVKIAPTYTMYPTLTPVPSYTPVLGEPFYYSRYDPSLLDRSVDLNEDGSCKNVEDGICHTMNCFDYDLDAGECVSMMTTGLDWKDYFGKSVACGAEYPLYTIFRVITPMQIAGDYECLDRCPACTGKKILDFLSTVWTLNWNYTLSVQVIYR
jgi:hypothetical protein